MIPPSSIRARRHALGLTIEGCEHGTGISKAWISRIETGRTPGCERMLRYLTYLGWTLHDPSGEVEVVAPHEPRTVRLLPSQARALAGLVRAINGTADPKVSEAADEVRRTCAVTALVER